MKKDKVILKANNFNYPSKEERIETLKGYPKLQSFQFGYKSELESILVQNMPINEAARESNLYWWSECLTNRLGKLQETYIYVMANYEKGFPDDVLMCSEVEKVYKFLFDYYAEVFYYFFFSARDIIGQILGLYYRIEVNENNLYFNKYFIDRIRIKNPSVADLLERFFELTKDASDLRNGFAHRFSPSEADYRSIITESDGKKTLTPNEGSFIPSYKIALNIKDSVKNLKVLMDKLIEVVK